MPPAVDVVAHPQDLGFHDGPANLLRGEVGAGQEHLPDGDALALVRLVPGAPDLVLEEFHRDLHVDARAVARASVRVHRAPVPDRLERGDPRLDHLARPLARDVDDEAHTAGRMFAFLTVETLGLDPRPAGQLVTFEIAEVVGHGWSPSIMGYLVQTVAARVRSSSGWGVSVSWPSFGSARLTCRREGYDPTYERMSYPLPYPLHDVIPRRSPGPRRRSSCRGWRPPLRVRRGWPRPPGRRRARYRPPHKPPPRVSHGCGNRPGSCPSA